MMDLSKLAERGVIGTGLAAAAAALAAAASSAQGCPPDSAEPAGHQFVLAGLAAAPDEEPPERKSEEEAAGERSVAEWTINGEHVRLVMKDGRIVVAELNGEAVAPERITSPGGMRLTGEDARVGLAESSLQLALQGARLEGLGLDATTSITADELLVHLMPSEPPKVLIGITMSEPDESLRRHFGLSPGGATLIASVREGLPAAEAGLKPFDIIVGAGDAADGGQHTIRRVMQGMEPGQTLRLRVLQGGQEKEVEIEVAPYAGDEGGKPQASRSRDQDQAEFLEHLELLESLDVNGVQRQHYDQMRAQLAAGGSIHNLSQPGPDGVRAFVIQGPSEGSDWVWLREAQNSEEFELQRSWQSQLVRPSLPPQMRAGAAAGAISPSMVADGVVISRLTEIEGRLDSIEALVRALAEKQGVAVPPAPGASDPGKTGP